MFELNHCKAGARRDIDVRNFLQDEVKSLRNGILWTYHDGDYSKSACLT